MAPLIDTDSFEVIDTEAGADGVNTIGIPLRPVHAQVSPDGRWLYVLHSDSPQGSVSVIDTASYELVDSIVVARSSHGLALSADGSRLYVASSKPVR
jgi:YVTN family beta-propeller protein